LKFEEGHILPKAEQRSSGKRVRESHRVPGKCDRKTVRKGHVDFLPGVVIFAKGGLDSLVNK